MAPRGGREHHLQYSRLCVGNSGDVHVKDGLLPQGISLVKATRHSGHEHALWRGAVAPEGQGFGAGLM